MNTRNHETSGRSERARRSLAEDGRIAPGLLGHTIERSWRRCQSLGMTPDTCGRDARLSHSELKQVRDRRALLLETARPQLDSLYAQIRDTHCAVLMADADGTILHGLGDADFVPQARRVELMPGGVWSESARGTNAIGTAVHDAQPVVVHGDEHFLQQNGFLTCAAMPLFGPDGRVQGALDISSDAAHPQHHTLALVNLAASMIENQWLERLFTDAHLLYFHPDAHLLGGLYEGMVAYDDDGRILGTNRWARHHLGLNETPRGDLSLDELFRTDRQPPAAFTELESTDGATFHTRHRERAVSRGSRRHHPTHCGAGEQTGLHFGDARLERIEQATRRVLGRGVPILLQGETGVGKEVWARALHQAGPSASGPWVVVNCAALPENLIEAELFGYRGGAFTGASKDGSPGRLVEADGGTLFLDEIGDMPLALQTRLLRVLQDRQVVPVGGGPARRVRFELISATNTDLPAAVEAGRFRRDLYYRINGLAVTLPPLREREDRRALIERQLADTDAVGLTDDAWPILLRHPWPGNLRQLNSVIQTAALMTEPGGLIDRTHLPEDFLREEGATEASGGRLAEQTWATIDRVIEEQDGNLAAAARVLGIDRSTLYRKLKRRGSE